MSGSPQSVPADAIVTVPSWLSGGRPAEFFRDAGLRAVKLSGNDGRYRVRTIERDTNRSPDLVALDTLATADQVRRRLGQLMTEQLVPDLIQADYSPRLQQALDVMPEGLLDPNTRFDAVTELLWLSQLLTQLSTTAALIETVLDVRETLTAKIGPIAGVHVVRRARPLLRRAQLPPALLRHTYDPDSSSGSVGATLQLANAQGQLIFSSSRFLFHGVFLLDPFLGPLLAAMSPAVWSLHAPRALGTIVYTLGRPMRGIRGEIAEPLQLLSPADMPRTQSAPTLSAGAGDAAITWWTQRLNDLFGVLTDPAVFSDTAGVYSPTKHLQGLLSTEQLFRRVHSILLAHRDSNAQRALMFAVLDALTGLTGRDLVYHCELTAARKAVARIRASMSSEAAEVLLPAADRAVDSLLALQRGFFLGRDSAGTHVTLTDIDGSTRRLGIESAAAQYLAAVRNGTHGFTARKGNIRQINALFAHHDGNIPADLALLSYLYLLDVLADPELVRRNLYRNGESTI